MKPKRITALLLALILTLSLIKIPAQAQSQNFADLEANHWVRIFLMELNNHGADVFSGIQEGDNIYFRPNMPMTRAMFATVLVRLFDLYNPTAANPFTDVSGGAWYASHVASAAGAGMIHGVNEEGTLFAPNAPVTRQEAFVMVANICFALPYFDEIDESEWAEILSRFRDADDIHSWAMEGSAFVAYHEIAVGFTEQTLRPANRMTRAEAAALLVNLLNRIETARIWDTPPTESPLTLTPGFIIVDNNRLTADIAVTGTATGEIALERGDLPDAIGLTADGDSITITGTRPNTGQPSIVGTHTVTVTRDGADTTLTVRVNLTPIPPPPPEPPEPSPPFPETDKTDLYSAYRAADYFFDVFYMFTPESFEALRTAYTNAALTYLDPWAEQDEVDAAYDMLMDAKYNLVEIPKEEFLLRVIRIGESSEQFPDRFTPDSHADMIVALDAARTVLDNSGAFEAHYDAATALWQTIRDLVIAARYQIPVFLAHARLYVNNPRYTQESRDVLRAAIDRAQAALDDPDATNAYLGEVLEVLRQAILGLQREGWLPFVAGLNVRKDSCGCADGGILCLQIADVLGIDCVLWMEYN